MIVLIGEVLLTTKGLLPFELYKEGKVRDVYVVGNNRLLIVATDRLSAFDVVLPNGIPYKGKVLTALSVFWFRYTRWVCGNHMLTTDVRKYPEDLHPYADLLAGRSMLVKKAKRIDVECVVRAYLSGSGWRNYRDNDGVVCGIQLQDGLRESDKLRKPIFTPATKEEEGEHDINITFSQMVEVIREAMVRGEIEYEGSPEQLARSLRSRSLAIYETAASLAWERKLLLADTKFEYGLYNGEVIVIDELLTPDSSRYWSRSDYEPGRSQRSFDKQYVRDYLDGLDWDKTPPAPNLPSGVVEMTSQKYLEALRLITGQELA